MCPLSAIDASRIDGACARWSAVKGARVTTDAVLMQADLISSNLG